MIQAADVSACVAHASHPCYAHRHNLFPLPISSGVKIVSKEGKWALLSADFSVTQFSHLMKQLLWHGRNSYWHLAKLAQFVIHHRLIILVMQAVFLSIFHFSPIALYQGWLIVGYATIYMMVPMFSLVLDRLSAACEWPFLCRFLSMS